MPKTHKVALLFEVSDEYRRQFLQGITEYSQQHGLWLLQKPLDCAKTFNFDNIDVDAMIISDTQPVDKFPDLARPIIVICFTKQPRYSVPSVVTDDAAIGKMAAKDLFGRRFRNFAYLGFDRFYWSGLRGQSFAETIAQEGFETHIYNLTTNQSKSRPLAVLADWLRSLPKPLALFACSDSYGQLALTASKIANIRIPDQLSILAVGNDPMLCNLNSPALSSIALNSRRAGYDAAQLLDKIIAGRKTDRNIIVRPTHIVTRQSTNLLAVDDKEIADAIKFIHGNAKEVIQVRDVVEAAALSRRALEQRFRKILGRSIHDEIRRSRIEHIARLLIETDRPISQIALQLGYPNVDHIARYFKREKSMSPRDFRRLYGRK